MTDALPPLPDAGHYSNGPFGQSVLLWYSEDQMRSYAAVAVATERERRAKPTEAMELAGMRALRNTHRTVSGEYSREQARACWDAMTRARKP